MKLVVNSLHLVTGYVSAWSRDWPTDNIQDVPNPVAIQPSCTNGGFTDRCVSESEFRKSDYEWNGADSCNKLDYAWNGVCVDNNNWEALQTDPNGYRASTQYEIGQQDGHDYNQAIHYSMLFYEAEQTGLLPDWNRIP